MKRTYTIIRIPFHRSYSTNSLGFVVSHPDDEYSQGSPIVFCDDTPALAKWLEEQFADGPPDSGENTEYETPAPDGHV